MPTKDEVENYLNEIKQKIKVFDIVLIEREKNQITLAELDLIPSNVKDYIDTLAAENYFRGPAADTEFGGEYWEFGMDIKNKEVYIKINYGLPNKSCICISFHFAEFTISYPYKV